MGPTARSGKTTSEGPGSWGLKQWPESIHQHGAEKDFATMHPREYDEAECEHGQIEESGKCRAEGIEGNQCQAEEFVENFPGGVDQRNGCNPDQDFEEELHSIDHKDVNAGCDHQQHIRRQIEKACLYGFCGFQIG